MNDQQINIEVLGRIISLETKLASTIDKLDSLIESVESKLSQFSGNANTPSIVSRVIQLENFNSTLRWSIGIIYTVLVGLILNLLVKGNTP